MAERFVIGAVPIRVKSGDGYKMEELYPLNRAIKVFTDNFPSLDGMDEVFIKQAEAHQWDFAAMLPALQRAVTCRCRSYDEWPARVAYTRIERPRVLWMLPMMTETITMIPYVGDRMIHISCERGVAHYGAYQRLLVTWDYRARPTQAHADDYVQIAMDVVGSDTLLIDVDDGVFWHKFNTNNGWGQKRLTPKGAVDVLSGYFPPTVWPVALR